jgi:adenylyltransferase/sulfurtransferase
VIHGEKDEGRLKVESARDRIHSLNSAVQVQCIPEKVTAQNVSSLIQGYDAVIDGTDNFPSRYLLNDACVLSQIPLIHGSVDRFEGHCSVFKSPDGPCYRCLFPEAPPADSVTSCAVGGVLGVLPGIIGILQATEVLKLILGQGNSLVGRLLIFNAMDMIFREVSLPKDPECPVCGEHPSIQEPQASGSFCAEVAIGEISPNELRSLLDRAPSSLTLLDVREPEEFVSAHLPNAKLIPLGSLLDRADEIERSKEIVVYCHSGFRSAKAARQLQTLGFSRIRNLQGGISAWQKEQV